MPPYLDGTGDAGRFIYGPGSDARSPDRIFVNSVNRYIANRDLTPVLLDLIGRSAAPLAIVESSFAADSSGFSTCRYELV